MTNQKTGKSSAARPAPRLPWWIFIMLAIGSYCTLKYLLPNLHFTNPNLQKFIQATPTFAPPISILFLLLAAKRLYDTDRDKEDTNQPDDAKQ